MLSTIRIGRTLAMRGITTSAASKDAIYYPGYLMSQQEHKDFLHHPNFHTENHETFHDPFPPVAKYMDKDPELNAIREKSKTQPWGNLTREEVNTLYDGHFRRHYYTWSVQNDRWKFYLAMMMGLCATGGVLMRCILDLLGCEMPEYYNDPKFLEQYITRHLQCNSGHLRGLATKWNYQNGEWNADRKPWYYLWFPYMPSPRRSGGLGFSKWYQRGKDMW